MYGFGPTSCISSLCRAAMISAKSCSRRAVYHARKTLAYTLSQSTGPSILFSSISSRVILAKKSAMLADIAVLLTKAPW